MDEFTTWITLSIWEKGEERKLIWSHNQGKKDDYSEVEGQVLNAYKFLIANGCVLTYMKSWPISKFFAYASKNGLLHHWFNSLTPEERNLN